MSEIEAKINSFVEEFSEFGVEKEEAPEGKALLKWNGSHITVNLESGEIDTKLKPDANIVVKLKDHLAGPAPSIAPIDMPVQMQASDLTVQDVMTYINPKATEKEAWMFLRYCNSKGLDPVAKECHLVIYEGKDGRQCSVIAGKEAFTRRAEENDQFNGFQAGIIVQVPGAEKLDYREGTFMVANEKLLGGWAKVWRKDRKEPFTAAVSLDEYDKGSRIWKQYKATMIRKVPLVQALREAFPGALGGMYDRAEME